MDKEAIWSERKGVTLIEMTIVIVIIGIALMVTYPSMASYRRVATQKELKYNQQVIINAVEAWVNDNTNTLQRPGSINSMNAQRRRVYQYILDTEFVKKLGKLTPANDANQVALLSFDNELFYLSFKDGVLIVQDKERQEEALVYTVFEPEIISTTATDTTILKNLQILKDNKKLVGPYE